MQFSKKEETEKKIKKQRCAFVQFFIASDDCFREKFCWYVPFSDSWSMMTRDTESGQLFQKKVTFTGPKEARRKKKPLTSMFFLVGGDKKGNLDLEIAHKHDIWLISESRLPTRVWKNPQEISFQNGNDLEAFCSPSTVNKSPFWLYQCFHARKAIPCWWSTLLPPWWVSLLLVHVLFWQGILQGWGRCGEQGERAEPARS